MPKADEGSPRHVNGTLRPHSPAHRKPPTAHRLQPPNFCYDSARPMGSLFQLDTMSAAMPLLFAGVLLLILIVSFRSRAVVFCQYLEAMTASG